MKKIIFLILIMITGFGFSQGYPQMETMTLVPQNAPVNPVEGQVYYDAGQKSVFIWNGSQWLNSVTADTNTDSQDLTWDGVTLGITGSSTSFDLYTDFENIATDAGFVKNFDINTPSLSEVLNSGSVASSDIDMANHNIVSVESIKSLGLDVRGFGFIDVLYSDNIEVSNDMIVGSIRYPTSVSQPTSIEGVTYWDSSKKRLQAYDGVSWKSFLLEGDVSNALGMSKVKSVSSIANLRNFGSAFDGIVFTEHYTEGNGVSNKYYYDSAITTGDNGGTIIKSNVLAGSWVMLEKDYHTPEDFGATRNGDATDALNAMIADDKVKDVKIPKGIYYEFNDPLVINDKLISCEGFLHYTGVNKSTATAITYNLSNSSGDFYSSRIAIRLRNRGGNAINGTWNWTEDDNFVGVVFKNMLYMQVDVAVQGFDVGVLLQSDGVPGIAYNNFYLGEIRDCRKGLMIESTTPSGWVNENKFYGGEIWATSNVGSGISRYGIWINDLSNGYKNNGNRFYSPSIEVNDVGSKNGNPLGEAVPVVIESGIRNSFYDVRNEFSSEVGARFEGGSRWNRVEFNYQNAIWEDNTIHKDNIVILKDNGRVEEWKQVVTFSAQTDIIENSGAFSLSPSFNWHGNFSNNPLPLSSTVSGYIKTNKGYQQSTGVSGHGIGVRLDASDVKKFLIEWKGSGQRVNVRLYDNTGAEIIAPDEVAGSVGGAWSTTTAFGGAYRQKGNDIFKEMITVGDNVDEIEVIFGFTSGAPIINGFTVSSFVNAATVLENTN